MSEGTLPRFTRGDFYLALCDGVEKQLGASRRKNTAAAYCKAALIIALTLLGYVAYLAVPLSTPQLVLLSIIVGLLMGGIGFTIQHDANHGAFARSRAINRAAAFTLDLMGVSSHYWRWKHNVFHHTFPNVDGVDTDVEPRIFACFNPTQRRFWFHRYQHFYVWFLYAFLIVRWQLIYDFHRLISGRMGPHAMPRPRGAELLLFVAGKVGFFSLAFFVPLMRHPLSTVLLFYAGVSLTLGWVSSLVFQLGHCFDDTRFRSADSEELVDWALHQVSTTSDFARDSRLLTGYLGGLNFQIEHHLFPGLPHVQYPRIAPIVEETCRKFGAPYVAHPTLGDALAAHWRFLKRMSGDEEVRSLESEALPESQGA